jgi:hypothetical protein
LIGTTKKLQKELKSKQTLLTNITANKKTSFHSSPGRVSAWVFLYPNKKIKITRPQAHN